MAEADYGEVFEADYREVLLERSPAPLPNHMKVSITHDTTMTAAMTNVMTTSMSTWFNIYIYIYI